MSERLSEMQIPECVASDDDSQQVRIDFSAACSLQGNLPSAFGNELLSCSFDVSNHTDQNRHEVSAKSLLDFFGFIGRQAHF